MATRRHFLSGLVVGAVVLTGCGSATDEERESTTFGLGGDHLTITKDAGAVELRPGDTDRVSVTRWFTGERGDATWSIDHDTLALVTKCGALSSCDVRYEITVPRTVAVTLTGDNGTITAAGFTAALSVRTDNGDIDVSDVSGDLTLRSANGAQHATALASEHVEARSENGEITLAFSQPPTSLAVTTDNGAVTAGLPDSGYAIDTHTASGDVERGLTAITSSPRRVTITTESGAIRLRPSP